MNNKNMNFIVTQDAETKDKLLSLGFHLVDSSDNRYTFLNCQQLMFDKTDKVIYTNALCF